MSEATGFPVQSFRPARNSAVGSQKFGLRMADTGRFVKILLILGVIVCFARARVSHAIEYETINNPSNSNSASSVSAQYSTPNANSRTLGGGSYYNEPKSSQYADYYYYPNYSYGNLLKKEALDSFSYAPPASSSYGQYGITRQGLEDGGDEDSGLYGLIGLVGLLGLVPFLIPILAPLFGILLLLLLPILLPIVGALLLPLLLIIAVPVVIIALILLFLPTPIITVPATGGRSTTMTSRVNGGLDMETVRMIYDAIGRDECIERYTCEVALRARGFGINMEQIYGFFLRKKPPTSPKWMHSIARGFKHNDDCKSYTCSAKLF